MFATDPRRSEPNLLATGEPSIEIERHLSDSDGADGIGDGVPLREQDINLAQLGDDLLGLISPLTKWLRSDSLTRRKRIGVRLWPWGGKESVRAT